MRGDDAEKQIDRRTGGEPGLEIGSVLHDRNPGGPRGGHEWLVARQYRLDPHGAFEERVERAHGETAAAGEHRACHRQIVRVQPCSSASACSRGDGQTANALAASLSTKRSA